MEEKKNLCAPIPLSLHQRLRAEQEQRGQTLSDYITDILREHFEGGARTMNANNRTIAFQVPEELFGRLKDYLALRASLMMPGTKNKTPRRRRRTPAASLLGGKLCIYTPKT